MGIKKKQESSKIFLFFRPQVTYRLRILILSLHEYFKFIATKDANMTAVNFRQAAHVGSLAVGFGLVPPIGALSTISALALSTLMSFGVELVAQKGQSMARWGRTFKNAAVYRIEPTFECNPKQDTEILTRAHNRVVQHDQAYQIFCIRHHFSSLERSLAYFASKFQGGTCRGQATALAEKLHLSKRALQEISKEDVYYYQMLFELETSLQVELDILIPSMDVLRIQTRKTMLQLQLEIYENLTKSILPTTHSYRTPLPNELAEWKSEIISSISKGQTHAELDEQALSTFLETRKRAKVEECTRLISELQQVNPYNPLAETTINSSSSIEDYKNCLQNIGFGYVHTPAHVFVFQQSPEGYLIYDSVHRWFGGLMKYPDQDTFIENLKNQIEFDVSQKCDQPNFDIQLGQFKQLT